MTALAARRQRSIEREQYAAKLVGEIKPGIARLVLTAGRFSILDVIKHCVVAAGKDVAVSIWTWRLGKAEFEELSALPLKTALLVIDAEADYFRLQRGEVALFSEWENRFGAGSIRWISGHAKMATIEGGGLRLLVRGSANVNMNKRMEQCDITEGGADFELIRRIELSLPITGPGGKEGRAASCLGGAIPMAIFGGLQPWKV